VHVILRLWAPLAHLWRRLTRSLRMTAKAQPGRSAATRLHRRLNGWREARVAPLGAFVCTGANVGLSRLFGREATGAAEPLHPNNNGDEFCRGMRQPQRQSLRSGAGCWRFPVHNPEFEKGFGLYLQILGYALIETFKNIGGRIEFGRDAARLE
jgi:hypothetical protein